MPAPDDILRILTVVLWSGVTVVVWRSDIPRRQWSLGTWYILITAVSVTVWRSVVAVWNLDPDYIPGELFRFFVREMQPSIYLMLGFALILIRTADDK